MALVEEEVLPIDTAQEVREEEPPAKLERQAPIDWKEKVACESCAKVLSRHSMEFTHKCKGPKPEKQSRARREPREEQSRKEQPREEQPPQPEQPTREQIMRHILREDKQRREAAMCGPMRRFYGLA